MTATTAEASVAPSRDAAPSTSTDDPRHDRNVIVVALVVMAVTTTVAVIANTLMRQVSSDDLAWQRLLDIWGGQGHGTAWISEDLFPTRYPLYLVLDALGFSGRRGVHAAAVILDVGAGAAFLFGLVLSGELLRPLRWRLVAALAVVSVWATVTWDQVLFSPNTRTLEFGLSVLLLALLGIAASRPLIRRSELAWLGAFAWFLWVSDPFVLYVIGGPIAVVAAIDLLRPVRRRRAVAILGVLAASAAASFLFRFVLEAFDVVLRPVAGGARHVTGLGDLTERVRVVGERFAALLGVSGSDLTSGPVGAAGVAWLRLGLVALAMAGAVITVRRWDRASLLARTLVVCVVSTPVAVVMVNVYADPEIVIDRYLGAALIGIAGLAVIAVDRLRGSVGRTAAVVMAALVVGAFASNVVTWTEDGGAKPDADAIALSRAVDGSLWDRVYGQYWLALRTDQIAEGGTRWVHVECDPGGRLELMPWHQDDAVLRGDPATIAVALEALPCNLDDLERAYGPAARTVTLEGKEFAVWETADASPRLRDLS